MSFLITIFLIIFIPLAYAMLALRIGWRFSRVPQMLSVKIIVFTVTLVFFAYLPFFDHIIGYYYWLHLCATEGGVRVNKVIELGPEYWNVDGSSKFIKPGGLYEEKAFAPRFKLGYVRLSVSPVLEIERSFDVILDMADGATIGTNTELIFSGGWFANLVPPARGQGCPSNGEAAPKTFIEAVFRPAVLINR